MIRVDAYQWQGKIYATQEAATRAIDAAIGDLVTHHARALVALDKYTATIAYLEANAGEIGQIAALQKDLGVHDEND